MSSRANPTLIGAFVVGAIVLAVAGALILGGRQWFARPQRYVMFFDGSVSGLGVGAPVQYRGVPLGSVTDIRGVAGAPQIAVFIELELSRHRFLGRQGKVTEEDARRALRDAISRGLRAQLQNQSLVTGQLYVGLDYFPDAPARLTGLDPNEAEIPTVPTTVQQASEQLKQLVARVEALPVEQLFKSTQAAVDATRTLVQSPEVREALRNLDGALRETRGLIVRLDGQIEPVATSARLAIDETRKAVDDVKREVTRLASELNTQIAPLAASTTQAVDATKVLVVDTQRLVRDTTEVVRPLAVSATNVADTARTTLEKAQVTLASVDGALGQESPLGYQLGETLRELEDAARAVRVLAEALERQPSSLIFGKRPPSGR